MKIERLEAHDRLQHLKQDQSVNIFHGAEECMKSNPLSLAIQDKSPYIYIFAHPRTAEDGVTKVMYWQPRLSVPEAQSNSYLFRAHSKTDIMEVCWIIPPEEHWKMYQKGMLTHDETVMWSIRTFRNNRKKLEKPHPDDMSEEKGRMILKQVIDEHRQNLRSSRLEISELSPPS